MTNMRYGKVGLVFSPGLLHKHTTYIPQIERNIWSTSFNQPTEDMTGCSEIKDS